MTSAATPVRPTRCDSAGRVAWRQDRASLPMAGAIATEEGYLRIPARIAKPGILTYRTNNGVIRELVPEETLKDPKFLASLVGKPLVNEHPDYPLNPDNVAEHIDGIVLSAEWVDGEGVIANLQLMTRDIIDAFRAGKIEVSPSYDTNLDYTAGNDPQFGAYDAIQRTRFAGNHVALTDRARGGSDVRLLVRKDSDDYGYAADVTTNPRIPPQEPPVKLSPRILAILGAMGIDPAPLADEDAALTAILAGIQAEEAAEVEMDTLASAPAIVEKVAEAGPVMPADAMPAKMDSRRVDSRRANFAKAHEALMKHHKNRTRLDSMAAQVGLENTDALGNSALTKAIVLKMDSKVDPNETHDFYRAWLSREESRSAALRRDSEIDPYREMGRDLVTPPVETRKDSTDYVFPSQASRKALINASNR